MKAKLSGGGITSNKLVRVGVRSGSPTANRVSPGAASLIGIKRGNHSDTGKVNVKPQPIVAGKMPAVPLGNALATNVGAGGPGKGRVTMRSGSQGKH